MTPLRYAVIGTGMMGQEHIRNLALLRDVVGLPVQVVLLVDPEPAMLAAGRLQAERAGFAEPSCHDALDARTLAGSRIDAAVLVSPNHTHRAQLDILLAADVAILAEKPLCTTVADCESLLARLARRGARDATARPFWTAMEYRYMPPTTRLIERAASGEIGRLRLVSIREHRYPFLPKVDNWNRFSANTGGTLVEKCCHHFDLMRLLTGSEPRRVYATGGMDVNHLDESYDGRQPDILDNAMVLLDFASGVRASLELCLFAEGSDPQEQITLVGERGRLDAFIPAPGRFRPDDRCAAGRVTFSPRSGPIEEDLIHIDARLEAAGDHHGSTFHQHHRFALAMHGQGPVEVSAADGAMAVAMGAAAHASIASGAPIDFIAPAGAL